MDDEKGEDQELTEEKEKKALKNIMMDIKKNLEVNARIYLISSKPKYREKYDFQELRQDIATSLPDLKQEVLLRTLKADTKGMIEEKESLLERRILMYSLSSAAAGTVPIPGLSITADIPIFYRMITEQREQLGLTNQDLATVAKEMEFSSKKDLEDQLERGLAWKRGGRRNHHLIIHS